MTRVFAITYEEHLQFQPPDIPQPTKADPEGVVKQAAVDAWRAGTKIVATEGYAEDAIAKARTLLKAADTNGQVTEVRILHVGLQQEAE